MSYNFGSTTSLDEQSHPFFIYHFADGYTSSSMFLSICRQVFTAQISFLSS